MLIKISSQTHYPNTKFLILFIISKLLETKIFILILTIINKLNLPFYFLIVFIVDEET